MECPACSSHVTMEVGADRPLLVSPVEALITANEDEQIDIIRSCWECGWHEERSVRIETIETNTSDEQVVERSARIDDITSEVAAIDSLATLTDVLAEIRRQRQLETAASESPTNDRVVTSRPPMTDSDALYDVHEQTGNPTHASVEDVCDRLLSRAADPRDDPQDAHFDSVMAAVVDRYGDEPVQQVVKRILIDQLPYRTAATDLDMRPVDGVWIGTTAGWFLQELNRDHDN